MSSLSIPEPLELFKHGVEDIYGPRLKSLILFGSQARGDAQPDSDFDIAVILDHVADRSTEVARLSPLRSKIHLQSDMFISLVFLTPEQLRDGERLFFRNIRSEGIPL